MPKIQLRALCVSMRMVGDERIHLYPYPTYRIADHVPDHDRVAAPESRPISMRRSAGMTDIVEGCQQERLRYGKPGVESSASLVTPQAAAAQGGVVGPEVALPYQPMTTAKTPRKQAKIAISAQCQAGGKRPPPSWWRRRRSRMCEGRRSPRIVDPSPWKLTTAGPGVSSRPPHAPGLV